MVPLLTITFGLVFALILGAYWTFVVRPENRADAALHKRMAVRAPVKKSAILLEAYQEGSGADTKDSGTRAFARLLNPIERLIERSGRQLSVGTFVLLSLALAVGAVTGLWLIIHRLDLALLIGCWFGFIPYAYLQRAGTKRMWRFEEQFPEAIDLVARALRAGHTLPIAIGMVASEVPNPVGGEFKKLHDLQAFGMSLPDALRAFAARVPILDARFFVTAVLTQRESGGNLSGVLDNLAAVIRERFKVKRQVRVISAHGRITAVILSALPPVLATILAFIAPSNMALLIHDEIGIKMIIAAVILQVAGTLIMRRIVNVEY